MEEDKEDHPKGDDEHPIPKQGFYKCLYHGLKHGHINAESNHSADLEDS